MSSLVTANNLINTWNLNGGFLDANFVSTIQGLLEDVNTVYSLANITDLGDEAIILDDTSLTANKLISLDGITSGVIDATAITTLTGAAADLNTAYDSSGISNLGDEAITLSDTSLTAAVLNTLDANTSGKVDAASINELTGDANQINTSYSSAGISNLEESAATQTPSIALDAEVNSLGIGERATINFTLNESSNDFTKSDVTVSGGTLSGFSGSGTSYSGTFSPNTDSNTDAVISVKSGTFSNSLGHLNRDGNDSNNSLILKVDTVRPTIALSSDTSSLKARETASINFILSETSTNFTAADVSISGGSLSNFSGSGSSYSATFTPDTDSTSDAVISVASSKFSDSAGNTNADGSESNNSLTISLDCLISRSKTNSGLKLTGSSCSDIIKGQKKDDEIFGRGDDDFLRGKSGNDLLLGGRGDDTLHGGQENDTLIGGQENDTLIGGKGSDHLIGNKGHDLLSGLEDNDLIQGRSGDDTIKGGKRVDTISGNQGDDIIRGGQGDDIIRGGQGDDIIRGGLGADLIHLSRGQDQIIDFKPKRGDRLINKNNLSFTTTELDGNLILTDINNNAQTTLNNINLNILLAVQPELFS